MSTPPVKSWTSVTETLSKSFAQILSDTGEIFIDAKTINGNITLSVKGETEFKRGGVPIMGHFAKLTISPFHFCCGAALVSNIFIKEVVNRHKQGSLLVGTLLEEYVRIVQKRSLLTYTQRTDRPNIIYPREWGWSEVFPWLNRRYFGGTISEGGNPLMLFAKDITQPSSNPFTVEALDIAKRPLVRRDKYGRFAPMERDS